MKTEQFLVVAYSKIEYYLTDFTLKIKRSVYRKSCTYNK